VACGDVTNTVCHKSTDKGIFPYPNDPFYTVSQKSHPIYFWNNSVKNTDFIFGARIPEKT